MVGITERNQQKLELANAGFSLKYIDEWQPKTTLYRHKPSYYVAGGVSEDIGTMVKGVPGSPDYVLRKSKIGLFPWVPDDGCECRWCVERMAGNAKAEPVGETPGAESNPAVEIKCAVCDYKASGGSKVSAMSRLKVHAETH
tara:strand:- start:312 stop:737 length:426 start_codon:yes stop_codon:yes gene_type:complete